MITKIDSELKLYLLSVLGNPSDTVLDFSFKLPDRAWLKSATSSENWINIYLLEVKENVELRRNEWEKSYVGGQVSKQKPPHYVDLYYLITFYNKNKKSELEHGYLENVLLALYDFSHLAAAHLSDVTLVDKITLELFPKPYIDDQLGFQFWNAIDQDARPYIPLKVTVPLHSSVVSSDAIVHTKIIQYETLDEPLSTLSGKVVHLSEVNGNAITVPVPLATLEIKKKGGVSICTVEADALGSFICEQLKDEALTIFVKAEGYQDMEIDLDNGLAMVSKGMTIEMNKQ